MNTRKKGEYTQLKLHLANIFSKNTLIQYTHNLFKSQYTRFYDVDRWPLPERKSESQNCT